MLNNRLLKVEKKHILKYILISFTFKERLS